MRSAAESWTVEFALEYVSTDSDSLLSTSIFSLNLLLLFEAGEVLFEVFLVMPGGCLFFLPSLCALLFTLAVVDE